MLDSITQFLYNTFGSFQLATAVSGMIPLLEIKGAICFGIRSGLSWWQSLLFAYLGSTFMFLPIFLLLRPILNALKKLKWFKTFAVKCENYIESKADNALKEGENKGKKLTAEGIKLLSVFIFVAIPLPMTGVYMGTAVATFLNIPFLKAFIIVAVGNVVAGLIILVLALICINIIDYILYGLFVLAIILLVIMVIKLKNASGKEKE